MTNQRIRILLYSACALVCLLGARGVAYAQSAMVQIPFTADALGVPAATYAGTSASACSASTPGYLNSLGDGCSPTQATLNSPYGAATDSLNNLYVTDEGDNRIRVVYQGGAKLAEALVAANPGYSFVPTAGTVYSFGGLSAALKSSGGVYYCNGTSGTTAYDVYGDGCPAQYNYMYQPRDVVVDQYGNIFATETNGRVVVIYIAGTAVANMITAYNNGITSPQAGYVYLLSAPGDFSSKTSIAVDLNENLYVGDSYTLTPTPSGDVTQATTYGAQVKKFTGTGWATYVTSAGFTSKTALNGDGGPVASAIVDLPYSIVCDVYGNLYIAESRIRVVYSGGPTPPLYVESAAATVTPVVNPQKGDIYTVGAGNTSGHVTGTLAASVYPGGSVPQIGVDTSGNVYFVDAYREIWRIYQNTGIAVILGGSGASSTTGSASTVPAAGVACNGTTGGPLMTDAYADGCPATEVYPINGGLGRVVFDSSGNFYSVEQRVVGSSAAIVRKYYFANQFAATNVGNTSTAAFAFSPTSAKTYSPSPSVTLALTGSSTAEFLDKGNDLCSTVTGANGASPQTCVYNIGFVPASPGQHLASISAISAGTTLVSSYLGGIGLGSQISLDIATPTTIGTSLNPSGLGVDQANSLYIADATTNAIYKSTSGAAPVQFATGFNSPAQIAIDGIGNLYVADAGSNRIAIVNSSGVSTLLSTFNSIALSAPAGVAADAIGNVYISDTGNNRILQVTPLGNVLAKPFSGLSSPRGLVVDSVGDLFVADSGNSRIVELTAVGVQSALTTSPSLITPVSVALDPAGDLFVADSSNLNVVEITVGASAPIDLTGNITGIKGVAVDHSGDVFVAASSLKGALEFNRTHLTVPYLTLNVHQTETQTFTITNTGNTSLILGSALSSGTDTTNFSVSAATTNGCRTAETIAIGQGCALNAIFQPQATGPFQDAVTFPSNAVPVSSAVLTGTGVNEISTTTALSYATTTGGLPLSGQAFTVTATITPASSGAAITGTVVFTIDNGTSTTIPVSNGAAILSLQLVTGAHSIVAVYDGDANYAASRSSLSVNAVVPAATSLVLAISSTGPAQNTVPFNVTATLASLAVQGAMTGSVAFSVDGGTPVNIAVANNAATITLTLPYGPHTVAATYSGDSYYITSSNTLSINVVANGTSSTSLSVTSPVGVITLGQSVVVAASITTGNATGTPTGTVTFAIDGSPVTTVPYASTVSAALGQLSAGMHSVTATYNGDHSYAPSAGTLTITVGRATPSVTLSVTPNVNLSGNTITITATVSSLYATPTGTVNLSTGKGALGTITLINGIGSYTTSTNVIGNYVFLASYLGDANFLPTTASITPAPTFIVSNVQASASMVQGGTATYSVNINAFYGYTGMITFSCTGLPANSVCGGYPSISTVPADAIQNVQIQIITNVSSTQAGMGQWRSQSRLWSFVIILLCILSASFWRKHCSRFSNIALGLIMLGVVLGVSGCGSDTRTTTTYTTPAGVYSVLLTGTDGTIKSSSNLTLTVVQGQ